MTKMQKKMKTNSSSLDIGNTLPVGVLRKAECLEKLAPS